METLKLLIGQRSLARKLKIARESAGLSQVQAAKLLRKTQSFISKAEAGQRKIHVLQLKEFARIYKKDIAYFLNVKRRKGGGKA